MIWLIIGYIVLGILVAIITTAAVEMDHENLGDFIHICGVIVFWPLVLALALLYFIAMSVNDLGTWLRHHSRFF